MFDAKAESQFRKSDISENLKALLSNQGVFYFDSFLKELHSSDSTLDNQIIKLKRDLTKIRETLEALRKMVFIYFFWTKISRKILSFFKLDF